MGLKLNGLSSAYVESASGLVIPKSIVDAKGDLIVGTADNTVARKAVGANNKLLGADSGQTDGLDWVNLEPGQASSTFKNAYGRSLGEPGIAGPMYPAGIPSRDSSLSLTANRAFFSRVVPSRDITLVSLGFTVFAAAGADDAVDVGIYNADLTTKIISTGATAGKLNSQGIKSITIAGTPLTAGTVYYFAISTGTQGGAAGSLSSITSGTSGALPAATFGTAVPYLIAGLLAASHPLPAGPVGALTVASGTPYVFGLE